MGWDNTHQPEVIDLFVDIVFWIIFTLSLNSMMGCIVFKSTLLLAYRVITDVYCITKTIDVISNEIFLSWWVDWILSNRSSWMQKYSLSNIKLLGLSGIPIKVQPYFFIKLKFFMKKDESFLNIFIIKIQTVVFCEKHGTR